MVNTLDKKIGAEQATSQSQPNEIKSPLAKEVRPIAEQLSEYIVLGAEAEGSKKVFEIVATNAQGSHSLTNTKKQFLQQQIARVQSMSTQELMLGIKRVYQSQIHELQLQARKLQHSVTSFSAYELNNILAKIRQIKDQMASLLYATIERLRELYIILVLKLKMVTL